MIHNSLRVMLAMLLLLVFTATFAERKCGPLPPTMLLMQNDIKQQLHLTARQTTQWNMIDKKLQQMQAAMQPSNRQVKAIVDREATQPNPDLLKVFKAKQDLKNAESRRMNNIILEQVQFFASLKPAQKHTLLSIMQANMAIMQEKRANDKS